MPTTLGSLRRLVLTPELADVTFARRGFPVTATDATRRLEAIPQSVVCGFEWGIDSRDQWEVERRLELVEPEMRGFAYEGATMAFTVRDAMTGGRGHLTRDLLRGPGQAHIFLTYIGIGFAMARLPRPLWRKVRPGSDRDAVPPDDELAGRGRLRLRPRLLRHGPVGHPAVATGDVPVARPARLLPARRRPGHRPGAVVHPRRPPGERQRRGRAASPRPARPTCGAASDWPPRSPAAADRTDCASSAGSRRRIGPIWRRARSSRRRPVTTPASCRCTRRAPSRYSRTCRSTRHRRSPTTSRSTACRQRSRKRSRGQQRSRKRSRGQQRSRKRSRGQQRSRKRSTRGAGTAAAPAAQGATDGAPDYETWRAKIRAAVADKTANTATTVIGAAS